MNCGSDLGADYQVWKGPKTGQWLTEKIADTDMERGMPNSVQVRKKMGGEESHEEEQSRCKPWLNIQWQTETNDRDN